MLSTALLTKRWLGDPKTALSVLISLGVWQFGSSMLIFLATIKNIPASFHEAAIVDGARPVKRFFSINLPMITPILFFNLINQVIGSFQAFNGTHDWYNAQCDMFARHGIMAYCFHFCGGCTRSQRSGKSTDMTLFTEKQDLLQMIDFISSLDRVDKRAVFLIGGSQGGIVTALAAEERADQLKGLMLYCLAFGIPDNWRGRFGADIPEAFEHWGLTLGKVFFTSMKDFSAYDHISRFKGPVLIFQGDEDSVVPPESSYRAVQKYEQAEVILLKSEGHGISENGVAFAITGCCG